MENEDLSSGPNLETPSPKQSVFRARLFKKVRACGTKRCEIGPRDREAESAEDNGHNDSEFHWKIVLKSSKK